MQMDEGLDTGPMLLRQTLDIRGKNCGQVTEEMAKLGASCLSIGSSNPTPREPQPIEGATYAAKIDKAEARIDWSRPADRDRAAGPRLCALPGSVVRCQRRAHQIARG